MRHKAILSHDEESMASNNTQGDRSVRGINQGRWNAMGINADGGGATNEGVIIIQSDKMEKYTLIFVINVFT